MNNIQKYKKPKEISNKKISGVYYSLDTMRKFFLKILQFLLKQFASLVLKVRKPEIVAVTGSVAKTSTKEAIFEVLRQRLRVAKSEGNLNNEIGLPLAILGLKKSPRWFSWPFVLIWALFKTIAYSLFLAPYSQVIVLEMAADKPGDIEYLVSFAPPKVAVVTAVGPSHLEAFGTIEGVAKEKSKLLEALPESGYAVLNRDDFRVLEMAKTTRAYVKYFRGNEKNIPTASAKLVGKLFGLEENEIEIGLQQIKPLKGRMAILSGIKNSTILDDSYNANPLSTSFALDFLKNYQGTRRIAVLGDMLELGDYAKKGHQEVGEKAKESCDLLLVTGENARLIAQAGNGQHFESKKALIDFLRKEIKEGDIILVKASRSMKFEEIVEGLCK